MIKLYYHPGPNPAKVVLFLEEAGLEYEVVGVDIRKGEQHDPAYLLINPNGKTPALTDGDATIFDSTAILLYLGQKTGKFMSSEAPEVRGQLLSWLMLVASGVGPYSGQAVHFIRYAPEPKAYALNRYTFEAQRHWGLIEKRLEGRRYMMGDDYTIVDMSVWGWSRAAQAVVGDEAWGQMPNLQRLIADIAARPAAQRAAALDASRAYNQPMDQEALSNLFPQNKRLAPA